MGDQSLIDKVLADKDAEVDKYTEFIEDLMNYKISPSQRVFLKSVYDYMEERGEITPKQKATVDKIYHEFI